MLLPAEQEALRASGISRDTVDVFASLFAARPVVVAKVVPFAIADLSTSDNSLIRWVATNGALKRGTLVRAVVWGGFALNVGMSSAFTFAATPIEPATANPSVSASGVAVADNGGTVSYLVEAWWRLSGQGSFNTPETASSYNMSAAIRVTMGSGIDAGDTYSGGAGVPLTNVMASREMAGVNIYAGKPQVFELRMMALAAEVTDWSVDGGWIEVL